MLSGLGLRLLIATLIPALLLAACAPATRPRDNVAIEPRPAFRPVTEAEAARALEFAELEFMLAKGGEREAALSPLSGLISPAYRHVIPGAEFRASTSAVSADASFGQLYRWNLRPLRFEELRPGDLVFYTDGSGIVSGAGLFAGWKQPGREFRVLVAPRGEGEATYLVWDLREGAEGQRLVAVGRLMVGENPASL